MIDPVVMIVISPALYKIIISISSVYLYRGGLSTTVLVASNKDMYTSRTTTGSGYSEDSTRVPSLDGESLRCILNVFLLLEQTEKCQQKTLRAVIPQMERMFTSLSITPITTAEFVTNSLSSQLQGFNNDSDNGCTFAVQPLREHHLSTLEDAAKA